MTDSQPLPPIPADLKEAGTALFRAITEEYELRPDELTVLHSAARLRDALDDLRQSLEGQSTTVLVESAANRYPSSHPGDPADRIDASRLARQAKAARAGPGAGDHFRSA